MRENGHAEGTELVIEQRYAHDVSRFAAMASELARLDADIIVAKTSTAVRAVRKVAPRISIVFVVADPVASGLVSSLAQPGGDMTGVATLLVELVRKRLQLLKELTPRIHISRC